MRKPSVPISRCSIRGCTTRSCSDRFQRTPTILKKRLERCWIAPSDSTQSLDDASVEPSTRKPERSSTCENQSSTHVGCGIAPSILVAHAQLEFAPPSYEVMDRLG